MTSRLVKALGSILMVAIACTDSLEPARFMRLVPLDDTVVVAVSGDSSGSFAYSVVVRNDGVRDISLRFDCGWPYLDKEFDSGWRSVVKVYCLSEHRVELLLPGDSATFGPFTVIANPAYPSWSGGPAQGRYRARFQWYTGSATGFVSSSPFTVQATP